MEVAKTILYIILISSIGILLLFIILIKYQERNTNMIFTKLNKAAEIEQSPRRIDFNTIRHLPYPVRKYFMNVFKEGPFLIKSARFK